MIRVLRLSAFTRCQQHLYYTTVTTLQYPHQRFYSHPAHQQCSIMSDTNNSVKDASVSRLLKLLSAHDLSGYIVPSSDAHLSEYVARADMRRAFISHFTGSAGTALILQPSVSATHKLWTDGRYFTQAIQQLGTGWELMKQGLASTPKLEDWCVQNLPAKTKIGLDPSTVSIAGYRALETACAQHIELIATEGNLIDEVWAEERPAYPANPVIAHPVEYAGEAADSKIEKLRAQMKEQKCYAFIVTALDEVAWLLNVRGSDIAFNPVFFSYAIVTQDDIYLSDTAASTASAPLLHVIHQLICALSICILCVLRLALSTHNRSLLMSLSIWVKTSPSNHTHLSSLL